MKKFIHIFLPLLLGGVVSLIINNKIDYAFLMKPNLAPPKIVFPIAWTILYLLIGIAYFLYKKNVIYEDKDISTVYYVSLAFNLLWSILFFALKLRLLSIIWIIILDLMIIYLIKLYFRKYPPSAYLNIPYIFWLLFATYLNIGIYVLN